MISFHLNERVDYSKENRCQWFIIGNFQGIDHPKMKLRPSTSYYYRFLSWFICKLRVSSSCSFAQCGFIYFLPCLLHLSIPVKHCRYLLCDLSAQMKMIYLGWRGGVAFEWGFLWSYPPDIQESNYFKCTWDRKTFLNHFSRRALKIVKVITIPLIYSTH